MTFLFPLSFVL